MTQSPEEVRAGSLQDIAAYVDSAAALRGLALAADHREAVIANLQQILLQSAPLMALELDGSEEAAPVFRP